MDRGMDGKAASDDTAHPAPAGSASRAPQAGMTQMAITGQRLRPTPATRGIVRGTWTATEPAKRDTGSALRRRRTAAPGRKTASGLRPAAAVPRNA